MIIRTKQSNKEYQYSKYKEGDVFEVINEYNKHYVCRIISGSDPDSICAVYKGDCEKVHLGDYISKNPIAMKL